VLLGGLVLAAFLSWLAAPAVAAETLFRIEDPRGDDSGDGTIRYPLNYYSLAPGDLDLVSLVARRVSNGTEFEARFAARVRSPETRVLDLGGGQMKDVARFGFYGTNLDLYIDTDRQPGSGGVRTLPGRKAMLAPETAWERAVVLTPRPYDAKSSLRRVMLKSLKRELAAADEPRRREIEPIVELIPAEMEQRVFFPTKVRVAGNSIRFFVPDEFLGGPARADWSYVIFTSGADVDQRFMLPASVGGGEEGLFILPVWPGGATDRFGGTRDDDLGQPPILDLVVPGGRSQEGVLSDYDRSGKRPVVLPGVVPAAK
jgi:hypothetical protein